MTNLQIFKELCQDLHASSDKPYHVVVLSVLQTRYASLLPEEMEISDIAYVMNMPYKTVSNILTKLVGNPSSRAGKSLMRVLAQRMNLKDFVHEKVLDDDLTHELLR